MSGEAQIKASTLFLAACLLFYDPIFVSPITNCARREAAKETDGYTSTVGGRRQRTHGKFGPPALSIAFSVVPIFPPLFLLSFCSLTSYSLDALFVNIVNVVTSFLRP